MADETNASGMMRVALEGTFGRYSIAGLAEAEAEGESREEREIASVGS